MYYLRPCTIVHGMDNTKTADLRSTLLAGLAAGSALAAPFIGQIRRGESFRAPVFGGQAVANAAELAALVQPGDMIFHGPAVGAGNPQRVHVDMATSKKKGIYVPGVVKPLEWPAADPDVNIDTVILRPKLDDQQRRNLRADLREYGKNAPEFIPMMRGELLSRRPDLTLEQATALAKKLSWGFMDVDMARGAFHEGFGGGFNPEQHQANIAAFEPRFEMMRNPAATAKSMADQIDFSSPESIDASVDKIRAECAAGRCSTSPALLLERHGQGLGVNRNLADIAPADYLNSPNLEPVAHYLRHPEAQGQLFNTPTMREKLRLGLMFAPVAGLLGYSVGRMFSPRRPKPVAQPWSSRLQQHLMEGNLKPAAAAAQEGVVAALKRLGLA